MTRKLAIVVLLVLCSTTTARAWPPWEERPTILPTAPSSSESFAKNRGFGSTNDYVQDIHRPVSISDIGVSVRDGWARMTDGHEVRGAEVIAVDPGSPAALAGIQPGRVTTKEAVLEIGAIFAIVVTPLMPLLQAVDNSYLFDNSDLIFAADGERVTDTLDLAARVQGLARGGRLYLTVARRGRRVQVCIFLH
jgi:S1-C subfamily serine protease